MGISQEKAVDFAKKYAYLIILVVCFVILNYKLVSPLQSLPSPMYGGDYYYQLGSTNHVKYGGNPLDSPNIDGTLPIYFIIYSFITGNIAKIFDMSAFDAEIFFSYIIILFSVVMMFLLVDKLFNNKILASISVLLFISAFDLPVIKYTDFVRLLLMPLFLLLLYNFMKNKSYINAALLGILYGIIGIAHSIAFMACSLLLLCVFVYQEAIRNSVKKLFKKEGVKGFIPYIIVLFIGMIIALLWWFGPIFVYHGKTSTPYTYWTIQDFGSIAVQFKFLKDIIVSTFFNFASIKGFIFSIFSILGAWYFISKKSSSNENEFSGLDYARFLFFSGFLVTFHYLVTENIFGFMFVPSYISSLLLAPILVLTCITGIEAALSSIKTIKIKKIYPLVGILIILFVFQYISYGARTEDKWYNVGKSPFSPNMVELEKYIVKNTDVNDVFLTTKEVGFALNGFTGRKLVISRRAQNDPFYDLDTHEIDQAIILYGNDTSKKLELLKKYDVKYLYWDYMWIQSEYQYDEQGKIVGVFDPLAAFYTESRENELKKYNVSYTVDTTWFDPSVKGSDVRKFKIIFISPNNYNNFTNPWKNDLEPYLKEVWYYDNKGQTIARLYEVESGD